jgi:hypothetical protein
MAIAVLTALSTTGCCMFGQSDCCKTPKGNDKCCEKRGGVGLKARACGASAEANASMKGINADVKTGM